MATIAGSLQALLAAEKEVERLEGLLAAAKAEVNRLEQKELPELFDEAEESAVESNGIKAKQKLKVIGSLPKVDPKAALDVQKQQELQRAAAFTWLDEAGYGPNIKHTVTAEFDKGDAAKARELFDTIRRNSNSAAVGLKEDIHPQTLFAAMRRRVEEGKDVPLETLGLSVITVVEITKRPKE